MRAKERGLVATERNLEQLEFHALSRREVIGRFDGGRITSDGGGLLLREVEHRFGLLGRQADCLTDYRNPNSIEHSVHELVSQRVYGMALVYEDLDDHDVLRSDSVLALLVGKPDLTGEREQNVCTRRSIAPAGRWRAASRNNSSAYLPIAPRRRRCGAISCASIRRGCRPDSPPV
jgi:hypothetical protein